MQPQPDSHSVLPALRQDLQILPGMTASNGEKFWLLHDPVTNAFFELSEKAFNILSQWSSITTPQLLERLKSVQLHDFDRKDIEEMCGFLFAKKLTLIPPGLKIDDLVAQDVAAHPPLYKTIFHKYLFFRVPLFHPQQFLHTVYPYIKPLYSPAFLWLTIFSGLVGFWLALEQWDSFRTTFLHFLTFEGLIYYGLTLAILKIFHELGHAFMAYRYGCRVPTIGVAFLVMFPILYTDTTDAYRLTDRRKRVMTDAAGMLVELSAACFALLLWSFLPEGTAKSAAFFLATTSWILSLSVNLNPLMRFDGYYLLTDLTGKRNLQERSFALAKWKLREFLIGLDHPKPIDASARETLFLLGFGYATWIYRFFLFIGIAILVHALFPRAIGMILFSVEILFFILVPIFKELLIWWSLRMEIIKSVKARISIMAFCCFIGTLFLPVLRHVNAPALLRPALSTEIFPKSAGIVKTIHIHDNEIVKAGQKLATLESPRIAHDVAATRLKIDVLNAKLSRRASDRQDRSETFIIKQQLEKEKAHLKALAAERENLIIRAPHDGIVNGLNPNLHTDRTIGSTFSLGMIVSLNQYEILSFVPEQFVPRLEPNTKGLFIGPEWNGRKVTATIHTIAPTSEPVLQDKVFSSTYRGPIAVKTDQDGRERPVQAIIRTILGPSEPLDFVRAQRGVVRLSVHPESPAKAIWRQISHVFIREIDF